MTNWSTGVRRGMSKGVEALSTDVSYGFRRLGNPICCITNRALPLAGGFIKRHHQFANEVRKKKVAFVELTKLGHLTNEFHGR
jgi:hypothetical protein